MDPVEFEAGGRSYQFTANVRGTYPVEQAFEFWMAYVARDLLRLGVFFRAQAIMIQIPGAKDYCFLCHDDLDVKLPPGDDDPYELLNEADRGTVLSVLIECLRRLDAVAVLEQIPEAKRIHPKKLSAKWCEYLDREAKYECGLQNVVAECLDELIVRPGFVEIDCGPLPMWWQERWAKIRERGGISIPIEPDDTRRDP